MTERTTLVIVGCGKSKVERSSAPARHLYNSNLFRAQLELAEKLSDQVLIMSARYGLVEPNRVIARYDQTLADFDAQQMDEWEGRIAREVERRTSEGAEIHVLAGERYTRWSARVRDREVETPFAGLGQGERLAALKRALQAQEPDAPRFGWLGKHCHFICDGCGHPYPSWRAECDQCRCREMTRRDVAPALAGDRRLLCPWQREQTDHVALASGMVQCCECGGVHREVHEPTDVDGRIVGAGARVELLDIRGRPQGNGVVSSINYPYWAGGWSITVDLDESCPHNVSAHQVRVIQSGGGVP